MPIRILHITPHLGGGVGRVLKHFTAGSAAKRRFSHDIACLDYANDSALSWSRERGIAVHSEVAQDMAELARQIQAADIVHLHWWNHPLINWFLHQSTLPASRIAVWAHVNGYHAPHLFFEGLLEYPDKFVLGTLCSRKVLAIKQQPATWHVNVLRFVFASAGFEHVAHVEPQPHSGFQVGYIGTVEFSKMHRDFLVMHQSADIPDARFVVCGGPHHELLRQAAADLAGSRFDIRGPVSDIAPVLSTLDVFGYPLNPRHYGASENALLEALACGVVPVVLKNPCEEAIVKHDETGLVANSPGDYAAALEYLYHYPKIRQQMSENARADAASRFGIQHTIDGWHAVYDEMLDSHKRRHQLPPAAQGKSGEARPVEVFLRALGDSVEAKLFRSVLEQGTTSSIREQLGTLDPIFRGRSNGSIFQYGHFFQADSEIQKLCDAISHSQTPHPSEVYVLRNLTPVAMENTH